MLRVLVMYFNVLNLSSKMICDMSVKSPSRYNAFISIIAKFLSSLSIDDALFLDRLEEEADSHHSFYHVHYQLYATKLNE